MKNFQRIIALLGPPNTGKTHIAIGKMLEYKMEFWIATETFSKRGIR